MSGVAPPRTRVLLGLLRLARFRADSLELFGTTPGHFLDSLAPFIALSLVGSLLVAVRGAPREGAAEFLMTLVGLLVPPVLSHVLAVRWGREARWLRFAVAFNWSQWVVPVVFLGAMAVARLLVAAGLPVEAAGQAALAGALAYVVALQWFLARAALGLGRGQAALMTLATDLGTAVVVIVPLIVVSGLQDG